MPFKSLGIDFLGKILAILLTAGFVSGVWITNAERQHAEFREDLRASALQTSSTAAQVAVTTIQVQEVKTMVENDRELQNERREVAQRDRDRMQRTLDTILEKLND